MLTTLRYVSRLRQKTLIHVYAKLLRISNKLQWCCANHLLINHDKTRFVLFGVRQLIYKLSSNITVPFLGQDLVPVTSAKDLSVTICSNLTFNDHIASLSSSLFSTLVQINRLQHLLSKDVLYIILNSLVFSKLFYCATIWS